MKQATWNAVADSRLGHRFLSRARRGLSLLLLAAATPMAAPVMAQSLPLVTLHSFNGADGASPYGLVKGSNGLLYGTTYGGGTFGNYGTVFSIATDGTFASLHSFAGADGSLLYACLLQGSDGNYYGTTSQGGTAGAGAIFRIAADGSFTSLHSFNGTDGAYPQDKLVQGSDGNFYGVTYAGGEGGDGTVFKMTPDGSLTTLHVFTGPDGVQPYGGLVQGSDGNFYGAAAFGGASGFDGTIFRIASDGTFATLYSFNGTDGAQPYGKLLQDADGNFYGVTLGGGANEIYGGTVFKITAGGVLTTLHSFSGADGEVPYGGLIVGSDGNYYGVTGYGGASNVGTAYSITPDGSFTNLLALDTANGAYPHGELVQAGDGSFYGVAASGGAGGKGTVFHVAIGAKPGAPGSLNAAVGDGQITLSWTAANGAASYEVFEGDTPGGESGTPVASGIGSTSATITGLSNGKTYYFTVAAANPAGSGAVSNEASATPIAVPLQVTGLTAVAQNGQVQLNWAATSGASAYTVYEDAYFPGQELPIATGVSATSYTLSGLTNGFTYYFEVAATNAAGSGPISAEVSATPVFGTVATPVFSLAGGVYLMVKTVTISDATPGAQIYYTTDGSTPTVYSLPYGGGVLVSASETLKAIALEDGYTGSAVASANYIIVPHRQR